MIDQKWIFKYPYLFGPGAKDPDEGKGDIECDDLISKLMSKFTGAGGVFSTASERHAFIYASNIGYNDVKSSDDVPPCPEFWYKEAHYWLSGIMMGRAAKKIEDAAPSIKQYIAVFFSGAVVGNIPQALAMIGIKI